MLGYDWAHRIDLCWLLKFSYIMLGNCWYSSLIILHVLSVRAATRRGLIIDLSWLSIQLSRAHMIIFWANFRNAWITTVGCWDLHLCGISFNKVFELLLLVDITLDSAVILALKFNTASKSHHWCLAETLFQIIDFVEGNLQKVVILRHSVRRVDRYRDHATTIWLRW